MKSGPHLFPHNILYGQSGFQIFRERHAMRYDRRFQRYHRLITLQRMADFWMDINQWTAEKIYSALIGIHEGIIPPLTIFWSCSVAMAGLCSTHGTFCVCKISEKWIDFHLKYSETKTEFHLFNQIAAHGNNDYWFYLHLIPYHWQKYLLHTRNFTFWNFKLVVKNRIWL